ncbi:NAD(P)-binding oxidoreductase [Auritidibacter ignavus]|uniref:SDR family oxidoreductase n=1 Tax=Auritidibacter ignavus TaxID=678932 RepID=A0AAJ6DBY5_9MICC|nr:NAD(P)-binding oxidoreductase [Auritidibacter ignavus]NIH72424.1 nucleoside-diphosphate-sugar epimerase [Auritidibacter ignavus]RMX23415.1 NAD(P)-dependent oxidoreductase [Auritidibacter ignavus]WGH81037.1 SDR family oxidoreductase [Auritidibacter ignavus]WGH90227.1 SDR family oxidoreductase [Auritidibacter ignavus]WGH92581.1 SDR family oxidoreductase [Auritidibacter ignavus]
MAHYIILGGHGKVALRAAQLLTEKTNTVTSVIRQEEQIPDVQATGATAQVLDLEQASQDDLAEAFSDQDAVIFAAGAGGGNPDRTYAVDLQAAKRSIDAAKQARVSRFILISYAGCRRDHGVAETDSFYPYAEAKSQADEYLRNSGLDYTILGPGLLTLEEPTGKIMEVPEDHPRDENERRETSRAHVASAIVAALNHPESIGHKIDFFDGDTPIDEVFSTQRD